jgi:ABC-type uncharacterized transport system substrate-binding protein
MRNIILFIVTLSSLYAHPHTFVEVYPTITIENKSIKQVNFKWVIDEMTSSMLIMEFDQNQNGKIDKDENRYIKENYFLSLKDYDFYTHLHSKYKIKNFKAHIKNAKIEYNFSFVLDQKKAVSGFSVEFYDTDFFVSMQLKEKFVTQKIPHKVEGIDGDFYYGYKIIYK